MENRKNPGQYPAKTEVIYSLKKVSVYFLSAIFFNVLGTVFVFGVSGKWNWIPAFIFSSASLIIAITAFVITIFEIRVQKIYLIYIFSYFTGYVLPLGYTFVAVLLTMHRLWGSVVIVLLTGLLPFLIPTIMKEHAKDFDHTFNENRSAGVYNPKTNIWKVSVPVIRKSQERDRKINQLSKAAVPFMYALAKHLNRLLGKYSLIFLLVLFSLLFILAVKEWLFFITIYNQIMNLERQTGKNVLLPTRMDNALYLGTFEEN